MDKKELNYLLKNSSSNELLIINYLGKLDILICPFKVQVKYKIGLLKKNDIVNVDEIKITFELITVYHIKGESFYYYHFDIIS